MSQGFIIKLFRPGDKADTDLWRIVENMVEYDELSVALI